MGGYHKEKTREEREREKRGIERKNEAEGCTGNYFRRRKDTGQHVVVERGEVLERVHNRRDEVVVPLDL